MYNILNVLGLSGVLIFAFNSIVSAAPLMPGATIHKTGITVKTGARSELPGYVVRQTYSDIFLLHDNYGLPTHFFPEKVDEASLAPYHVSFPSNDEWSGKILYGDKAGNKGCYFQFRLNGDRVEIASSALDMSTHNCTVTANDIVIF